MNSKQSNNASENTQSTAEENSINELGEIRNILFGEHIKKLESQIEDLRSATQEQLKLLREDYSSALTERADALYERVNSKLEELDAYFNKRFDEVDKRAIQIESGITEIEHQQQQESRSVKEEMEALNNQLLQTFEQGCSKLEEQFAVQAQALSEQKMDRAALSELFSQLAEQLNHSNKP